MAVKSTVSSFKVYNEFKNDLGFVSNLGDFTNNLAALVMENVKVVQEIDISWEAFATASDGWVLTGVNEWTRSAGSFINDGFAVGDNCDFFGPKQGAPTFTSNVTVTSISSDGLTITFTLNSGGYGGFTSVGDAALKGLTPLTALIYGFGLIENNETYTRASKVSGDDQGYYSSNIGFDTGGGVRSTAFETGQRLGSPIAWQTGTMQVRYVSNPSTYVQRFEIEHEFTVVPYYLEGELTNLENNILPDLFAGLNSLKYAYDTNFRTVLSNPNTEKTSIITNNLGSTGWYNENFNGFNNSYSVKSIDYQEAGSLNTADGILIGTKSRVTVLIEGLITPFTGAERFGVYVSYLPDQVEYTDTPLSNLKENFIYDRAINNEGLAPTLGSDFITLCEANVVGADLEIVFEMEYSSLQKSFLSNKLQSSEANYVIGIEVGDNALTSASSDRVILLADAKEYDESPDIPDLISVDKLDFFQHNIQIGVDTGFTDSIQWNEDGFVVDFDFYLDLNKSAVINDLIFKLVAHNTVTGQLFELDSYNYNNIGSAIISGGVQQLIENTTRGYNLATGDQFNDVTIEVGSQAAGLQHYTGKFAQKVSWQDWLNNTDVDTIFFDASQPNNNLNFRTSNYSDLNDYEIKLGISASMDGVSDLGVSGTTSYLFLSPNLITYDYDLDANITPIWSGVIETLHPTTLADLGGQVLTGLDTILKTTWTNSGGAVTDISQVWAVHRIEETEQPGYNIDELSSINLPPSPNRLIPTVGETLLTVDIVAGTVVTQCLVDGSQITAGQGYNLSARIHDDATLIPAGAKETEAGVIKETEVADIKIIE